MQELQYPRATVPRQRTSLLDVVVLTIAAPIPSSYVDASVRPRATDKCLREEVVKVQNAQVYAKTRTETSSIAGRAVAAVDDRQHERDELMLDVV